MIFARGDGASRSARSRRALPGQRRRWPYVLMVLVIVGLAAGGTVWFLRDGRRLAVSIASLKGFFRSQSAKLFPAPGEVAVEAPGTRGKDKGSGKVVPQKKKAPAPASTAGSAAPPSLESLRADNDKMAQQLQAKTPTGYYLVINTAGNRVILHNGDKVEAEMVASCGSGNVLEDPKGGRRWTFDTPRGVYKIKSKITNPVWMKPDWAFIEEGEPIPTNRADRAEPGMMGDFALGIGDGYFIHGTLYTRLLGRNVSHGCVRLGDADLERLYRSLEIGTQVFIY